jgi:hypothetical protein
MFKLVMRFPGIPSRDIEIIQLWFLNAVNKLYNSKTSNRMSSRGLKDNQLTQKSDHLSKITDHKESRSLSIMSLQLPRDLLQFYYVYQKREEEDNANIYHLFLEGPFPLRC